MRIPLDRRLAIPLYRQIENFLRQGIQSGQLLPATRLPASRRLARALGVNRITVEQAYANLEADGLTASRRGSGTYVLPPAPLPPAARRSPVGPWPAWQAAALARPAAGEMPPPDEMLAAAGHAQPISFAEGVGDARLFPVEDFRKVIQTVMRRDGLATLTYGDPAGYAPLRRTLAHVLASQGLPAHPENILITSGSQQALALVAQQLLQPGEVVLVENPTYAGALDLFRALRLKCVGVPLDANGLQVDLLEAALRRYRPKLIYTIPTFHNPTGVCLSGARRRRLLALAERYNVPILEDDFVGDLRYTGRALPALKALDPGGRVIYISTFSKMLMPGLRVGFLVAEGPVYADLLRRKRAHDVATSNLLQRALEAYVTVGRYQAHLRRSAQIYRQRRDVMLAAIQRHLPAGVRVTVPAGGLFIWLRLPVNCSADELLPLACEAGVAFAPGSRFFLEPAAGARFVRLNCVAQPREKIEAGLWRLGQACRRLGRGVGA